MLLSPSLKQNIFGFLELDYTHTILIHRNSHVHALFLIRHYIYHTANELIKNKTAILIYNEINCKLQPSILPQDS